MTAEPTTRTTFKMGADVPEWLLSIEPRGPTAVKKNFRFMTDVDVFETPTYFLVLPTAIMQPSPMILDLEGTFGCNVASASKPVWMCHQRSITWPSQVDAKKMVEMSGGMLKLAAEVFDPQREAKEREAFDQKYAEARTEGRRQAQEERDARDLAHQRRRRVARRGWSGLWDFFRP